MKNLILLLIFIGITVADNFPAFPMSIYGNIKIGTTNISAGNIKIYDSYNNELANYVINKSGKYGAETVTDTALVLNEFLGNITIKVLYNGKIYTVDKNQVDDSNKENGCPSKANINFVSKNCRYDITLTPESSGGGGGGSTVEKTKVKTGSDILNTGFSITPTKYTGEKNNFVSTGNIENNVIIESNPFFYSNEILNAYSFSYSIGITTQKTLKDANLEGNLVRAHMAKMMVNYAINVVGLTLDNTKECNFDDIQSQSDELKSYIKSSCQLGIMGVGLEKFNPDGLVTRAEFGTVLSRILYGDKYNGGNPYYVKHLKALKENGIINNDNPSLSELRGYVMLMLMRVGQ